MSSGTDKIPLPGNEDYICTVLAADNVRKNDYNGVERDFIRVELSVDSFADGGALEDIDSNTVTDRKVWRDIDTSRLGFRKDGTASLSRQFLVFVNGLSDITERVPDGDTKDLIGKKVIASLIVYTGVSDGKQRNKIVGFKPTVRQRRKPASIPANEEDVKTPDKVSDDVYAKAVASLVNDTDDPSDEEISQTMAALK
jgi:hypothetical protein